MKSLLRSPILAAVIVSAGLVTSALIVARPTSSAIVSQSPSEQTIRAQFVSQVRSQVGDSLYDVMGTKRQLQDIVID